MAAILRRNPISPFPLCRLSTLSTSSNPNPLPSSPSSSDVNTIYLLRSPIRSESDPERIADLFQSSTHIPRFYSHRLLYQLSVDKLRRSRRPDLIERLLESQKSDPSAPKSEGFLIRILSLYSSSNMVDHAVRTFDQMPQIGCPRTERSLCALLTAFLDNRQFDRLRESFDRIPKEVGLTPALVSHNILLKALCEDGNVETARSLLDEMSKNEEVMPNLISYNTVLNGYLKKGDESGFEEILKEISSKGLDPNVVTYNCRISAQCGRSESFKAEELLDVMVSKGVQPNLATFNSIIDGFCREGDLNSAVRVFKRMRVMKRMNGKDGVSPHSNIYIVLVRSLVEKGEFDSALEICRECLVRKFAPPFEVVKGLVDGLLKDSKVEEATDIVEKMKMVIRGDAVDAWKKLEATLPLNGTASILES